VTPTFIEWLRKLAEAQLLVDPIPPAFRGLKWEQPVEIDGDWTGAALEGSVSLEPGATPLDTFTITGPVVTGTGDDAVSTWTASLSGAEVTALTADSDGDHIVQLAAMFRLTPSGGDEAVLMGGTFTVMEQA
jgi:hypothetical protein